MATERLSMRKTRDILRLKWALKLTHREAARSLGVSAGIVGKTITRAKAAGLTWSAVEALNDDELEQLLYGAPRTPTHSRPKPDPVWIHLERKKQGVTLELLHLEYLAEHPDGYGYTVFCDTYRAWLKKRKLTMRHVHRAGDKLYVDYSGKKPSIIDPKTGEVTPVELFVAVLGASSYTYAEATRTQKSADFIASHTRALEYIGGVPAALVPDQLKSGVLVACRYEPTAQRTYHEMAQHYSTAIVPARPGKPRDKAKVEVGVQVVQRWILARIRHERFFSLEALNARIWELLDELNGRPMKHYGGTSRRDLFERLDQPALVPLPARRFVHATWKTARVNIDYHIEFDKHYYSVPFALVRETVEVRATAMTVEVFSKSRRVASHTRSYKPGRHTTERDHMPKSHQAHAEWTPTRLITWAGKVGAHVEAIVRRILDDRPHPEQGYRSCLGILRLEKHYGAERLDAACERALRVGARSYRPIESILKNGLDRVALDDAAPPAAPVDHENVSGPDYYH